MNDEITVGGMPTTNREVPGERRLVPMQVGSATVYVEQVGPPAQIEAGDEIYPVAPSPRQALETASELLRECVRVVGDGFMALGERRPQEVTVEFTVSFEAKGTASLIPFLVTGESRAETGLKVTAKWTRPAAIER